MPLLSAPTSPRSTGRGPGTGPRSTQQGPQRDPAEEALAGYTIGVTTDRRPDELAHLLESRGARVVIAPARLIEVPVDGWAPPIDPAPLCRLVDLIVNRLVDAVTFTAAPAIAALLGAAEPDSAAVLEALRTQVLAACLGPVTAAPLRAYGVPVAVPAKAALSCLVRLIAEELPKRAVALEVAGHSLILRGHAAIFDGELRPLAPGPMAVLRALANAPGLVLSRAVLLRKLPRGADEHAVEMAVARLRAGLGASEVVQTVVKRGYRLPA